jgi:predicted PurR-regulated permease PerM
MMMNRKRLGRVMAVVAVILAAFFLLSSILIGLGTNVSYNLFDLIGGQNQTPQADQGPTQQDAIDEAKKDLEQNPKDPDAITDLGGSTPRTASTTRPSRSSRTGASGSRTTPRYRPC